MNELSLSPLPAVVMKSVVTTVSDETEIPLAVAGLLSRLGVEPSARDREVMFAYDGESDATTITVAAALEWADGTDDSPSFTGSDYALPPASRGVIARLEHPTGSTADAWIALDAAVAEHGLTTRGPYRHLLHVDGGMTLAAPVRDTVPTPGTSTER